MKLLAGILAAATAVLGMNPIDDVQRATPGLHTPFVATASGCGHCHSCEADGNSPGHDFHEIAPTPNRGTNHVCFAGGGTCLGHLDCESGGGGGDGDDDLLIPPVAAAVRDEFNRELLALPTTGASSEALRRLVALDPSRVQSHPETGMVSIRSSCDAAYIVALFPLADATHHGGIGD